MKKNIIVLTTTLNHYPLIKKSLNILSKGKNKEFIFASINEQIHKSEAVSA